MTWNCLAHMSALRRGSIRRTVLTLLAIVALIGIVWLHATWYKWWPMGSKMREGLARERFIVDIARAMHPVVATAHSVDDQGRLQRLADDLVAAHGNPFKKQYTVRQVCGEWFICESRGRDRNEAVYVVLIRTGGSGGLGSRVPSDDEIALAFGSDLRCPEQSPK